MLKPLENRVVLRVKEEEEGGEDNSKVEEIV